MTKIKLYAKNRKKIGEFNISCEDDPKIIEKDGKFYAHHYTQVNGKISFVEAEVYRLESLVGAIEPVKA